MPGQLARPVRGGGALRSEVQALPETGEANDDPVLGYPTPHNAGDGSVDVATLLTSSRPQSHPSERGRRDRLRPEAMPTHDKGRYDTPKRAMVAGELGRHLPCL